MPILKPKSASKTRTLSARLPASLVEEVEAVKQAADSRGLLFDVAEIVERALSQAVKSARGELDNAGTGEGQA